MLASLLLALAVASPCLTAPTPATYDPYAAHDQYGPPQPGPYGAPAQFGRDGGQFGAPYGAPYGQPYGAPYGGPGASFKESGFKEFGYGPNLLDPAYGLLGDYHWSSLDYDDRRRCASLKFVKSYSQTGVVQVHGLIPPLTQYTIQFWVRTPYDNAYTEAYSEPYPAETDIGLCQFLFSYTVTDHYGAPYDYYSYPYHDLELAMACINNLQVFIGGEQRSTGVSIADGVWHHLALTVDVGHPYGYDYKYTPFGDYGYGPAFTYADQANFANAVLGHWCFYCDGYKKAGTCATYGYGAVLGNNAPLKYGRALIPYGSLVLGGLITDVYHNLVDAANIAGSEPNAYIGSMYGFHFHSFCYDEHTILDMVKSCKNFCGDVFSWFDYWSYSLSIGINIKWDSSFGPACCVNYAECFELEQQETGPTAAYFGPGPGLFKGAGAYGPPGYPSVFGYDKKEGNDNQGGRTNNPPPNNPPPKKTPPKNPPPNIPTSGFGRPKNP